MWSSEPVSPPYRSLRKSPKRSQRSSRSLNQTVGASVPQLEYGDVTVPQFVEGFAVEYIDVPGSSRDWAVQTLGDVLACSVEEHVEVVRINPQEPLMSTEKATIVGLGGVESWWRQG